MPNETGTTAGGLGKPSKRGRPSKADSSNGSGVGVAEHAGGVAEPAERIENAKQPEPEPARPGGFIPIDPLTVSPDAGSGNGDRPRRGRKAGGKNRPKEETVQNLSSLLKIERLLVTGCFFLGNIASCPELHINESEAAEVSDALKELSKHYPIGMSEKTIAWVNFSFAVGGVFGPKIVAIVNRPVVAKPGRPLAVMPAREAVDDVTGPRAPAEAVNPAGPAYSIVEPPIESTFE